MCSLQILSSRSTFYGVNMTETNLECKQLSSDVGRNVTIFNIVVSLVCTGEMHSSLISEVKTNGLSEENNRI